MMTLRLPRYVIAKRLASGAIGFYFTVPTRYRQMGCTIPNEPLGSDYSVACGSDGNGGRAAALNGLFDEWLKIKSGEPVQSVARYGTIDWLFREYKNSKRYRERVSRRTRGDYELLMQIVLDLPTKRGDCVGQRLVKSITPLAADKIYEQVCVGPRGLRPRQGEKVVALCRASWRVVHRLYPDCFDRDVPNPWEGVTKHRRIMKTKPAATREQVYQFAWGAIDAGFPEPAAAAVICFEFLQRPENVLAGYLAWPDYRGQAAPNAIKITQASVGGDYGTWCCQILRRRRNRARPRRGVAMILKAGRDGVAEPYDRHEMAKIVRSLRGRLGLPVTFTLDACRHGGMTSLKKRSLQTARAGRCPVTAPSALMRVMRSGPWSALCRRPGSAMPMRSRTLREHPFRMSPDFLFRMKWTPTTQPLPN
jgi:hypothetical protein